MASEIVEDYVCSLYRSLLLREPDAEGLMQWSRVLHRAGARGFKTNLEGFVASSEYQQLHAVSARRNSLERHGQFDFSALSGETLAKLFAKTATYWRTRASDPEEMYWSVLSNAQFLGRLPADVVQKFLAYGQIDVNRIERICAQIDYDFSQCRNLLDFGCGVGRLLVNLPASIHGIHGVDFSSAHLAEASKNAARFGKAQNVSFYPVETLVDLQTLPKEQDIIHSFIVLQHSTPPVMEKVVGDLLPLLATGGIAMLHIPIAKACYQFIDSLQLSAYDAARAQTPCHQKPSLIPGRLLCSHRVIIN